MNPWNRGWFWTFADSQGDLAAREVPLLWFDSGFHEGHSQESTSMPRSINPFIFTGQDSIIGQTTIHDLTHRHHPLAINLCPDFKDAWLIVQRRRRRFENAME
jgi:hypothetical protein